MKCIDEFKGFSETLLEMFTPLGKIVIGIPLLIIIAPVAILLSLFIDTD